MATLTDAHDGVTRTDIRESASGDSMSMTVLLLLVLAILASALTGAERRVAGSPTGSGLQQSEISLRLRTG